MELSIIIPVYNSEHSLKTLIEHLKRNIECSYEIIFVNDCSNDKSTAILNAVSNDYIHAIHLTSNHGQQHAIFMGMSRAKGDYILTMDDDLQHNPSDIMTLVKTIKTGFDLVYGVNCEESALYRQLGSKLTGYFFKSRFKHMDHKRVSSFRIFTKELNQKALLCPYKYIYLSGIMLNLTENIGQVHVYKRKRLYGSSGYDFRKLIVLYLKLQFYYGRLPEFIKPKRANNENSNDTWRRQLSVKRH